MATAICTNWAEALVRVYGQSMGRGTGIEHAQAGARRSPVGVTTDTTELRSTLAAVNAVFPLTQEVDTHLGQVSAKAQRSVAGAQGRLFSALQDIYEAQDLAASTSAGQQQLAQTMTDNALWYTGRIMGAFDKTDEPYLRELRGVLRTWGTSRGPGQVDYLQEQGLLPADISAEQVADWRARSGELYEEAFSSPRSFFSKKGDRPVWNALSVLERTGRARQKLRDMPRPAEGSYADRLRTTALKRADTLVGQAHTYLGDLDSSKGTYDAITPFGPEGATQVEAIAAALTDPASRQLNQSLEATGVLQRHRMLVAEGTGKDPDSAVLAVPDSRWLKQMSTYAGYGAEQHGDILALNVSKSGIFVAPDTARSMLRSGIGGGFDEIAAHELIHTTQKSQPVGNPLPDRSHPSAYPGLAKRHQAFESHALEGATQAQTNHLRRQHDPLYDGKITDVYPTFTQMVDEAQSASGVEANTFYRELSATPTHQRTGYLARALTGRDDEQTKRDIYEPLLALNLRAEEQAARAGGWQPEFLAQHRARTREVVAGLVSSR